MYRSSGIVRSHSNPVTGLCDPDGLRFVTIRRPVTAFGIPGLIILIIGVFLAYQALLISVETGDISGLNLLICGTLICNVAYVLILRGVWRIMINYG